MSLVKDFESPHLDVRRVPGLGGMAGRNCVEISSHDSFKITMENNHVLLQKYGQWRVSQPSYSKNRSGDEHEFSEMITNYITDL